MSLFDVFTSLYKESFTCDKEEINKLFSQFNKILKKSIVKCIVLSLILVVAFVFCIIFIQDSLDYFPILCIGFTLIIFVADLVAFLPLMKIAKEIRSKLTDNPEINAEYIEKKKTDLKKWIIIPIIMAIVGIIIACFATSSNSSDKYDGYSADYEYNEEYRGAVNEFADEYGEDPQSVDRIFQHFGKHS